MAEETTSAKPVVLTRTTRVSVLRTLGTCLVLSLLGATAPSEATTVYRWVDAQGVTHFGNQPPAHVQAEAIPQRYRPQTPAPVRETRCRDFRGALVQLDALDDVEPDNPQWLEARQRASAGVERWCD